MARERIKHQEILRQVEQYYTRKLTEHGATHKGVDWKSEESQSLRFDQLVKVTRGERDSSIIDYGCGYGAMARYLRGLGYAGQYFGFDISEAMIAEARREQAALLNCTFVTDVDSLEVADYTIAGGIFNVKQHVPNDDWQSYVIDTIREMAKHSRKGFSFNM